MKEEQCIIYITLLTCAVAFNLSCPEPGHWNHRATAYCIDLNKYTCLIDTTKNRYIETCDGPRVEIQGYKSTINRNNFNTAKCKSERYQGLDFTTVGNSDCVFQKSKCVQEGQIVYKVNKDSSLEDDTKCMCDYTKGYLFITLPTSRCFCTPTVEDCSCFREFCSTDYQCTTEHQLRTRSWNCTNILFSDDGGDDLHTIRRNMAQDDPTIETSNVIAAAITVIFSILLMIGLVCWYKRKTNKGKIGGVMNLAAKQDPTDSSNESKVIQTPCLSSKPTEGQKSEDVNMGHANNENNDIADSTNDDKRSVGSSHYSTASETSQIVHNENGNNIGSGAVGQEQNSINDVPKVNMTSTSKRIEGCDLKMSCLSSEPTKGKNRQDLNTANQDPTDSNNESKVIQTSCLSSKPTEGQKSKDLNTAKQDPTDSRNESKVNQTSCLSSEPTEGKNSQDLNTAKEDPKNSSNESKVIQTSYSSSEPTEGQKSEDLNMRTAESMPKINNEEDFQNIIDVIDEKCTKGIESDSCTDTISVPHDTSSTGSDDNGNDNIAVSKDLE